jgi:hypothetical protein
VVTRRHFLLARERVSFVWVGGYYEVEANCIGDWYSLGGVLLDWAGGP